MMILLVKKRNEFGIRQIGGALMKYTKRCLSLSIILLLMFSLLATPASANSAQMHWRGTDATGAIIADENCPLIVEHELLTFDIGQFPESY